MLLTRLLLAAGLGLGLATSAIAQTSDTPAEVAPTAAEVSVPALTQALQLDALFAVLRDEGIASAQALEADMFPDRGGAQWVAAVEDIYDLPSLRTGFDSALQAELADDPETLAQILAFFTSDLGQRVVGLEIEARRAFLDTATEEAARVAADDRFAARDPRVSLLERFIKAGDLIEMNVAGALSGNLAFMTGMAEAGTHGQTVPADQLMSDVWAQEDQIRDDTTSWLYAYLGLAYAPLTEAEMQEYVDFMESPAGKRLNAALFTAFDKVFRDVSHDLGREAGLAMLGTDI
jgi:hypothetical protein